ncbi:MAG: Asp-tRNA(Asn)/Glu-tRNA(Gln) amidotransferase subunit GatA, partial [Victivallales bacterium]|nr:Asp-tRNA(Asn)/Glu-tRNA(Gln) amidotransferase subunit GatA [Victivallales bacterium]
IGPLTKDVRDSAILLDIISGHDPKDSTSLPDDEKVANLAKSIIELPTLQGVRIGIIKEYMQSEGLDNEVRELVMKQLKRLEALGADLVEVSLPHTSYAVATYYVIATAEASANLARFDGIRYGRRAGSTADISELYLHSRGEGFGKEVKRRILLGTFVLSSGYYDAYYLRAQKVRTLLCRDFEDAFRKCDLLAGPTAPAPAFKIGERLQNPMQMYLSDIFTISLNLAGGCGISMPAGNHSSGLPVGIQIMGPTMGEKKLLQVAAQLEYN